MATKRLPRPAALIAALVCCGLWFCGCRDDDSAPICPLAIEEKVNEKVIGGFDGVDLLLVVDSSGSMAQERANLAPSVANLISVLVDPPPSWMFSPLKDLRVAVVTADMGLQTRGGSDAPAKLGERLGCDGLGDDGRFRTIKQGSYVDLPEGQLECMPLQAPWAESTPADPHPDLAVQVACLSQVGTGGCGIDQPLKAAEHGLLFDPEFIRSDALLAVIVISDEDDCSVEDDDFYQTEEIQNPGSPHYLNVVCNRYQDTLYSIHNFRDAFIEAKDGRPNAVHFIAIVGVPHEGPGAEKCQGRGSDLDGCLDQPEMEGDEVLEETASGSTAWFPSPVCERRDSEENLVAKARPGRRFVSLAQELGSMSHIYSICNEDWSPAVEDLAELATEHLCTDCYPEPLDWDPTTRTAVCNLNVEYIDPPDNGCPFPLQEGDEPIVEERTDSHGDPHTNVRCPVPQLPAPLACHEAYAAIDQQELGWFYCEDRRENFNEACDPEGAYAGLDEDGDGLIDCADDDCLPCQVCGGTGLGCALSCKFAVELTDAARMEISGQQVQVRCPLLIPSDDPNCQEANAATCTNGEDDDRDGVWDCDAEPDLPGRHGADPGCCPMTKDGNECVIDEAAFDNCPGTDLAHLPDACLAAAQQLQCQLPLL